MNKTMATNMNKTKRIGNSLAFTCIALVLTGVAANAQDARRQMTRFAPIHEALNLSDEQTPKFLSIQKAMTTKWAELQEMEPEPRKAEQERFYKARFEELEGTTHAAADDSIPGNPEDDDLTLRMVVRKRGQMQAKPTYNRLLLRTTLEMTSSGLNQSLTSHRPIHSCGGSKPTTVSNDTEKQPLRSVSWMPMANRWQAFRFM